MRWCWLIAAVLILITPIVVVNGRGLWHPYYRAVVGRRTIDEVMARYADDARARLEPHFQHARIAWPPDDVTLLVIKDDRRLELWTRRADGEQVFIQAYPILAASGRSGPKLREGDRQVPEGLYAIESLNPNSSWHLSMKLNYPNDADWRRAATDGRTDPGSNIFVHGKAVSIGCIAVGDQAIEDLFVLVALTGVDRTPVFIAPSDPRIGPLVVPDGAPIWTAERYSRITAAFEPYRHSS